MTTNKTAVRTAVLLTGKYAILSFLFNYKEFPISFVFGFLIEFLLRNCKTVCLNLLLNLSFEAAKD